MANKIVSLLLQVKNAISPGVKEAANDMAALESRSRSLEKELSKLDNAKAAAAGLDDARVAAQKAEQAFDEAQLEVIKLKNALKSEKTPELAIALEKANTAARSAKKEWQDSAKSVTQLEKAVKNAGGDLNDLATTQHELSGQIDRANGALRANKQHLDKARQGFEQTNKAVEKAGFSFSGFVAKAAALIGVVAVIDRVRAGFSALASNVWETGNQFELLDKRLNNFELGYIEEFARNVPQSLEGVADAFLKLRTFGIDPMNGSLQGLVDTTAAMGGSQVELEGIILAVGQAWSKQKLQQEEALQLIERGVPVWDLLAKAMGKTVPQLQAMSTAGELGRREIQLLMDAMAGANAGAAAKQMDSMQGLVSGLQDRFTSFYRQVADAGVWDYLKAQFQSVTAWFDQMTSSGQMEKLAKSISDGFISAAETVRAFIRGIAGLRDEIVLLGQIWLALKISAWSQQVLGVTKSFATLRAGVAANVTALNAMGVAARAAIGAFVISQIYNVVTAYRDLKLEIAALDKANREQQELAAELAKRFAKISEETGVLVASMDDLERAVAAGTIVIDEQTSSYLSAEQAAKVYADRAATVAAIVEKQAVSTNRLSDAMKASNSAVQEAVADNKKLGSVLQDEVLKALNGGIESVGGFALALRSIEQQGGLTADQINEELSSAISKLSDPERARFGKLLADAMALVENGAETAGLRVEHLQRLINSIDTARTESALKRLGLSQEELAGSISKGMQQSVDDLQVLAEQLDSLGGVGNRAGEAVYTALANSMRNIRTEADRAEFSTLLDGFYQSGRLAYAQYEELKNSVRGLADATSYAADVGRKSMKGLADGISDVQESADSTGRSARAIGESFAAMVQGVRGELAGLSDAAAAAFDMRMGIAGTTGDMDDLTQAITNARTELGKIARDSLQVFDPTGLNRFKNAVHEAKNETIIAFSQQQQRFEEFMSAMQAGEGVSQSFINQARASTQWMQLLGDQDLKQLRSALDDAEAKLRSVSDAAKSTVNQLQDELDRLQNNQDAINQRDYENKRAELQNAIADARLTGNQEAIKHYTEALKVLEQVRAERNKQSADEKKQEQQTQQQAAQTNQSSATKSSTTTTINLQSPSGNKAVQLTGDQNSVNQLLAVLEDAGLRSS